MKKFIIDLQMYAGENNELSARSYQLEFKKMLEAVFAKRAYFGDFFGGGIEALDGVQENETAFYVKTSDIPVAVGTGYDKGAAVAMGAGTGSTSRFGNRTEIVYSNTPVQYSWGWNWHEGIDRHTVNTNFDSAVADRLELQAQAKTKVFNEHHSKFISGAAVKSEPLADYTADAVLAVFNNLSEYFTNIEANGTLKAKVNAKLYNAIVDHPLTTSGKGSGANIDDNKILSFKDFEIEKLPASMFQQGECCYAYIAGIGKAFTGISTARTIESEDFDGVAFQGAGRAGEFVLPANKKAIAKVTIAGA